MTAVIAQLIDMHDLARLLPVADLPWQLPMPDGDSGVPDPPPAAPPGLQQPISTILAWGKWGVLVCGVAGLFICAGQMAIGRKNRSTFAADGATGVPWVLGGLSLVATASAIVKVFLG